MPLIHGCFKKLILNTNVEVNWTNFKGVTGRGLFKSVLKNVLNKPLVPGQTKSRYCYPYGDPARNRTRDPPSILATHAMRILAIRPARLNYMKVNLRLTARGELLSDSAPNGTRLSEHEKGKTRGQTLTPKHTHIHSQTHTQTQTHSITQVSVK